MGVTGLWKQLEKAGQTVSFEKLALEVFDEAHRELADGKSLETDGLLGLRVGIDASGWFFHSYETEGGANPELRTLFHRIIRLVRTGALVLFVFDGPHRPNVKRGNRIYRGDHSLEASLIEIIEAFGCEWRKAPGEAEAELAMLNRTGVLDVIISDDVDSFLFGALAVHRNALVANPSKENFPRVYRAKDVELQTELTIPGLILIALMAGGDYDQSGLTGVGPKIAIGLAKGGYGEQLARAIQTRSGRDLDTFLHAYREDIRHQMRTNERGLFERKAGAVASKIPDTWPDVKTAKRYYAPATSEAAQYASFRRQHLWHRMISIPALTQICDEMFEFTHPEILQKLRNLVWECVVAQQLIRSLHTQDTKAQSACANDSPSKQLANVLDGLSVHSPQKNGKSRKKGPNIPEEMQDVFHQVTKARSYNPGKKITQEVQLVIRPTLLAEQVRANLRFPDPNVGKLQQRKAAAAALIAATLGPDAPGAIAAADRNSKFDDPDEHQKLWIQQSLIEMAYPELIEQWEEKERLKAEGKLKKGKKSPAKGKEKAKAADKDSSKLSKKAPAPKKPRETDSEDDLFNSAVVRKAPVASTSQVVARPAPARRPREQSFSDSDSDVKIVPGPNKGKGKGKEVEGKVVRSPAKSPRKSESQTTAKEPTQASAEGDVPLKVKEKEKITEIGKAPSKPPKKVPPAVLYREISDSSDDDPLPAKVPILSYAKIKAKTAVSGSSATGKSTPAGLPASSAMQPSLSTSSTTSFASSTQISDSGTPSDGATAVRARPSKKSQSRKPPGRVVPSQQIIDLCSSD